MGENGGVIFDLGPFTTMAMTSDAAFGYWKDTDMMPFDADAAAAFRNEMVYVNIHTEENPGGELRGQVLRSSICSDLVTSVFDTPQRRPLNTYPNPATDVTRIDLGTVESGNYVLTLTDLSGKMVSQKNVNVNNSGILDVQLNDLNRGIYFIQLSNENTRFTAKVVKH